MRRLAVLAIVLAAACSKTTAPLPPTNPLVDATWLREHRDEVVLVDMQSTPELYGKGHLNGALYANVEDFRDEDKNLAPVAQLTAKLGSLGIDANTHVVAYDEKYGRNAGWLWYVLEQLGHTRMSLLDGGMDAFAGELEIGAPPSVEPKEYVARKNPTNVVDVAWVQQHLGDAVFLDARPVEQYTGEKPKEGMLPGHLPGARSLPWDAFRGPDGRYLDKEGAAALVKGLPKDRDLVLYCNSYHQAAHLQFQLARLGFTNLKAFDGSLKAWQKDPSRPLKTGNEP
jgi:thiosulfate/3-mercaptopyruvate sulfurtransferase